MSVRESEVHAQVKFHGQPGSVAGPTRIIDVKFTEKAQMICFWMRVSDEAKDNFPQQLPPGASAELSLEDGRVWTVQITNFDINMNGLWFGGSGNLKN